MRLNHPDEARLTQSLNKLLDEMPLMEPSSTITDRIMRSVLEQESNPSLTGKKPRLRSEVVNSFIASAATILLIQSGIVNKILNIDTGINQLTAYIQQFSQFLQS
ncbi:hypothetical protein [Paenibacillus sedimenti]|uniref:Uncharacterized protein n=1 Tax=Paenibacillus sedimenti TaxID=2770274 RepID=A0A926KWQ7_9BACL|nr:hypothetical protein [Paenibacillus sedimenti]MBD0384276.1 hypothetical protein [Paenibacillus sedimenti]